MSEICVSKQHLWPLFSHIGITPFLNRQNVSLDRCEVFFSFQVAATHQLLGYNNIWIVPGIKDTINKSLVPMQVIAIRRTIESRERSMLSSDQIIMAVKYGNEMMACDAKR